MNTVVALGSSDDLDGFALAGVRVVVTTTERAVTEAWSELDRDVGLVILSADAAHTLATVLDDRADVLTVVMP
jgi:vacuolar-type H+-ATPase subunit F/Vma7